MNDRDPRATDRSIAAENARRAGRAGTSEGGRSRAGDGPSHPPVAAALLMVGVVVVIVVLSYLSVR